jgi:hypothetical protein
VGEVTIAVRTEAVHCRVAANYCTLHDCMCGCDGCLPHSDPTLVECKTLRRELAEARLALEQLAANCNACTMCLRPGHTTEEHEHAANVGCPIEEVMAPR